MTPAGFLPIQFEASDDFGVTEVQVRYAVEKPLDAGLSATGEAASAATSSAAPSAEAGASAPSAAAPGEQGGTPGAPALTYTTVPIPGRWQGRSLVGEYVLQLEPLVLAEGDTVVYSIRAADNRSIDPQTDSRNWGESRRYQVHVVSTQAKREELRLREEEALREIQLLIDRQKQSREAVEGLIPQTPK